MEATDELIGMTKLINPYSPALQVFLIHLSWSVQILFVSPFFPILIPLWQTLCQVPMDALSQCQAYGKIWWNNWIYTLSQDALGQDAILNTPRTKQARPEERKHKVQGQGPGTARSLCTHGKSHGQVTINAEGMDEVQDEVQLNDTTIQLKMQSNEKWIDTGRVSLLNKEQLNIKNGQGPGRCPVELCKWWTVPELACNCYCKFESLNGLGRVPLESTAESL